MTLAVSIVQNKAPIDSKTFQFLLQFSPPEKRQRILCQRIKQNTDNMVVGGALVRHMLWEESRIPENASISYGEFGKPYLTDYPEVHFSISHSGRFVACAVCDQPVGIDIQEIATYRRDIAAKVCTHNELYQIEASAGSAAEFTKIWTIKEAKVKAVGSGIWSHLRDDLFLMGEIVSRRMESAFLSIFVLDSLKNSAISSTPDN